MAYFIPSGVQISIATMLSIATIGEAATKLNDICFSDEEIWWVKLFTELF